MDYNEILNVLIAICPTVSLVVTTIGGIIALIKSIKAIRIESDKKLNTALKEVERQKKQLDKIVSKVSSIESVLIEEREKERRR